ncbi:hypothetical protein EJ08DRAFT_697176 [Tothia fuscella]|uniref:DUF7918 domain-containing protein n=1 Tax=Tothia fuscella TaxID=1048955 RepID=A0A9P4NSQ0_9PEZI|nr:hypothetical protein EJ08DRAFT_697176 [Tothia fuscella]
MAILSGVPGLTAEIRINNIALKEYPVPEEDNDDAPTKITKYVEAQEDANFKLYILVHSTYEHRESDIVYDTSSVDQDMITRVKEIGKITVTSQRAIAKDIWEEATQRPAAMYDGDVPEKALKGRAVSCRTSLDKAISIPQEMSQDAEYIDNYDDPFATFTFRYRTLDALKSELIVPRSPSATRIKDEPVEDPNPQEIQKRNKKGRKSHKKPKSDAKVKTESKTESDSIPKFKEEDIDMDTSGTRHTKRVKRSKK